MKELLPMLCNQGICITEYDNYPFFLRFSFCMQDQ
jgi:hypothetical protein